MLAKEGFTLIRNALEDRVEGGLELAKDIAEALHNLPEENNQFLIEMTIERVNELVNKYPQCGSLHHHITQEK